MNEIKCPKCGEVFQIDESSYAAISKQVRDKEFNATIREKEKNFEQEKINAVEKAKNELNNSHLKEILEKNRKIQQLEAKKDELQRLIDTSQTEKELAIKNALSDKEKDLFEKEKEISLLQGKLETEKKECQLIEKNIKENYENQIKAKDEQIAYYKDFKAKQSVKLLGESLEQHCEIEFNKLRAIGFQKAYFEKITIVAREVKAIIYLRILTRITTRFFRLCLK